LLLDTIDSKVVDTEPVAIARKLSCDELSSAVVADNLCFGWEGRITCRHAVEEAQARLGMVGDGAGMVDVGKDPDSAGAPSRAVLVALAALGIRLW